MAARTYVAHKTDIDTDFPTPAVVWAVLDTPEEAYDHRHVATVDLTFNGVGYVYVARVEVVDDVEQWGVEIDGDGSVVLGQVSWEADRTAFATYWEHVCEAERQRLASRNYGKDVVGDHVAASKAKLTRLDVVSGTFTLSPEFDGDTFTYTANGRGTFELRATRDAPRSVVLWEIPTNGIGPLQGLTQRYTVPPNGMILQITVTSENGEFTNTYTITVSSV